MSTARRIAISCFLIFHLVSIACWALPLNNRFVVAYKNIVRPYFVWTGLFQSWDMFSPSPKAINSYLDAIVLYAGGSSRTWSFPRMEQLGWNDRYFKERYRKFTENLGEGTNAALWPDAARFIARLNDNGPAPVTRVFLIRHWSEISQREDGSFTPGPWQTRMFFRYIVEPDDLK